MCTLESTRESRFWARGGSSREEEELIEKFSGGGGPSRGFFDFSWIAREACQKAASRC